MFRLSALIVFTALLGSVGCVGSPRRDISAYQARLGFDAERATLSHPDVFERFDVPKDGTIRRAE